CPLSSPSLPRGQKKNTNTKKKKTLSPLNSLSLSLAETYSLSRSLSLSHTESRAHSLCPSLHGAQQHTLCRLTLFVDFIIRQLPALTHSLTHSLRLSLSL
ncbi:hypothetical protein GIB67_026166, partial [Kingdonia uniflora]